MAGHPPLPREGVVFGLDHSRAATGIAIGSLDLGTCRPLTVLRMPKIPARIEALKKLIEEWTPVLIVVGLPLTEEGTEQAQTRRVREFTDEVQQAFKGPVVFHDERFSTVAAEADLKNSGLRASAQREIADAEAAREIIQGFLDLSQRATHLRDPA